ncbi:predicted protein, partial [Haematococcus lacustris]
KKSNPFGAARPREEVLKEKGVDPLALESKLEVKPEAKVEPKVEEAVLEEVTRDDSPAEVELREEVEACRRELATLEATPGAEDSVAEARTELEA